VKKAINTYMAHINPTYIISDGQSTLVTLYKVLLWSQSTQVMRPTLTITSTQLNSLWEAGSYYKKKFNNPWNLEVYCHIHNSLPLPSTRYCPTDSVQPTLIFLSHVYTRFPDGIH